MQRSEDARKTIASPGERRLDATAGAAVTPTGRSLTLLRQVLRHCPVAGAVFDRDLCFLAVSQRYLERNRLAAEGVIGRHLYDVFPDLDPRWIRIHRRVLDGHAASAEDDTYVWPDGSRSRVRWQCRPWHTEAGRVGGMVVFTEFITARKRTEAALQESERRMATLLANLPGMAYRCRNAPNYPMEFISQGCRELTGYEPRDLIDNPARCFKDLIVRHGDSYEADSIRVQRSLAARRPFELTYRIRTRDGTLKWVLERGTGVTDATGRLVALEGFITDVTDQRRSVEALRRENLRLRSAMGTRRRFKRLIGQSPAMQEVFDLIEKAAATDANVIVLGESGTGKELVARAIHDHSRRADRPFLAVNCSAIPEGLIETAFFGHRRGAFSGAHADHHGTLARVDGGTLFLDEVGDIGAGMQAKLLRVLEDGSYIPVGGTTGRTSDFRLIGATHHHLAELVATGLMREDFFYRISVLPIVLPPLRDRRDDIPLLIDHFFRHYCTDAPPPVLSGDLLDRLLNYHWPGNVRELQNVLQRYAAVRTLDFFDPPAVRPPPGGRAASDPAPDPKPAPATLRASERELVLQTLQQCCWNRTAAARRLGISRRALYRRIEKFGLQAYPAGAIARIDFR